MEEMKPQVIERYCTMIASLANEAIAKVEGVSTQEGLVKYKFGLSSLKDCNVHVYIDANTEIIIDIFVNVDFGYSVPEVVCTLQETIKNDVEEATKFIVKRINVNVANINP